MAVSKTISKGRRQKTAALESSAAEPVSESWFERLTGNAPTGRFQAAADELAALLATDPDCRAAAARRSPASADAPVFHDVIRAVLESPVASEGLRTALMRVGRAGLPEYPRRAVPTVTVSGGVAVQSVKAGRSAMPQTQTPKSRRLRVFALDPSLAGNLDSADLAMATIAVRYERLKPGPVGDYLEVVDVDPASGRAYAPVDLDNAALLASDGLDPSEGNPRFHQQMVYAVAMKTIAAFEDALGRRSLWASRREADNTEYFVPRLRIYPHALRDANAYYSPDRIALLFGYFPADTQVRDAVVAGTMVFACLSADVIAHEMSHALLDGLHRRYQERSNPDVAAFHEGFADIVALFLHFTYTDLVRASLAKARGDVSMADLLGGLAKQFGEGRGKKGPLRDYLDPSVKNLLYPDTLESHDRGAILVAAVYEAFISIVEKRNRDLIGLATGGSGLLPAGQLQPGLVDRLTRETCKVASQVLRICIRALDYCPPVDITFGDYLRALMTADLDQVAEDTLGYRTAFLQAFRARNLLPPALRTVSIETLAWRKPKAPVPWHPDPYDPEAGLPTDHKPHNWLARAIAELGIDWGVDPERVKIFERAEKRAKGFWSHLNDAFVAGLADPRDFGLIDHLPSYQGNSAARHEVPLRKGVRTNFEVHSVRRVRRVRPDGSIAMQIVVVLSQRRWARIDDKDADSKSLWFRGGATLIVDPFAARFDYIIIKDMASERRLGRQREFQGAPPAGSPMAMYFDTDKMAKYEPFALLHRDGGGDDRD